MPCLNNRYITQNSQISHYHFSEKQNSKYDSAIGDSHYGNNDRTTLRETQRNQVAR